MEHPGFRDRFVFPASELPSGFRFPPRYLSIITASEELPNLDPWWFLAMRRQTAEFWLETVREQYPSRQLIPIAKNDQFGDTLACFEGTDTSGNPAVHLIHAYTEPGWEQRGTWANFDEWYRDAEYDAAEFAAENEE
jgi:hypothetical protein